MIDKWLNKIDKTHGSPLILFLVAIGILIAAWMQYIQHGWINPDSVLYLEQARLFSNGNWPAGFNVFNWPLYGLCIGFVHTLTNLGIHQSAQTLNMLFFAIATFSYLKIIQLSGGDSRSVLFGALLLFSSQYIVGDALEMLMRDQGFWACFLTATLFFIRYCQKQQIQDAIAWQVFIILATLFRIEGILYLLLLPLAYITLYSSGIKSRLALIFNTYFISIFIAFLIAAALLTNHESTMSQFGRLDEIFTKNIIQDFTDKLATQSKIMAEQVLGRYLDEFAIQGLLLTFIYVIVVKIISTTGLITTALAMLGIKQAYQYTYKNPRRILLIVAAIALVASLLIIIKVFVLSGRYIVPLTWILLVFASLYISELSKSKKKGIQYALAVFCVIISLGLIKNTLPKRDGYNYRQEAVAWAKSHSQNQEAIFYDDVRMTYFAKAPFRGKWNDNWLITISAIGDRSIYDHELILISHSKKHPERLKAIEKKLPQYIEVKRFYNSKKRKFISIYKRA